MSFEQKTPLFPSQTLKIFFSGICVGAADIVPGISGGTVAFIIGMYEKLLQSISSINRQTIGLFFRGHIKESFKIIPWQFLLLFFSGVAISFITLAKLFSCLLNHEVFRVYLYASFFGLVLGSSFFCLKKLNSFGLKEAISLFLGIVIAFFLTGADFSFKTQETLYSISLKKEFVPNISCINFDTQKSLLVDVPQSSVPGMIAKKYITSNSSIICQDTGNFVTAGSQISQFSSHFIDLWVVFCGIVAISAMLLPGISGSYMLHILGMYGTVLGALVDFLEGIKVGFFDIGASSIVFSMMLGIAIGAVCFAKFISFLLFRYYQLTLSCLIGFMIGALRSVWPFWTYQYKISPLRITDGPLLEIVDPYVPNVLSFDFSVAVFFIVLGFSLVFIIEIISLEKKNDMLV